MTDPLGYPGVYIEEISSYRSIGAAPTSVTAFVGRALRGPIGKATTCLSFSEFENVFGGLSADLPLPYSVRDFFANGGGEAVVLRLFAPDTSSIGVAQLSVDDLTLEAVTPGGWGNALIAEVTSTGQPSQSDATVDPPGPFNLTLQDATTGDRESFLNLTVDPLGGDSRVDVVLAQKSRLVRVGQDPTGAPLLPQTAPTAGSTGQGAGGDDGAALADADILGASSEATRLQALADGALFNILIIPPEASEGCLTPTVMAGAVAICAERRALLILDAPVSWEKSPPAQVATEALAIASSLPLNGVANAAVFFPRLISVDPLRESERPFAASGAVAGVIARTDTTAGPWKAPSGLAAGLLTAVDLSVHIDDIDNATLNVAAVNCLRSFPNRGSLVWGGRTLAGSDANGSPFKYIAVRRTALHIEGTLRSGLQWVSFEPNGEVLWPRIIAVARAFLDTLFEQGAFQGASADEAFFVKCDGETTTPDDIQAGVVNLVVGFAPLKPAEFVIVEIAQVCAAVV